jgi:Helix-turn-helix domain of resolvase
VLCHNCNAAKEHFGVCPHKSGQTREQFIADTYATLAQGGKRERFFQEKLKDPNFKESRPWKSAEMLGKERPKASVALLGNKNAKRKLNEEQVREIRKLGAEGTSHHKIAKLFGVSRVVVRKIIQRVSWKEVQ